MKTQTKLPQFYGTKNIAAKPMTRREYNEFRGWELPGDEEGSDEGYMVEYLDGGKPNVEGYNGYISWSPKEQFDNAYQPIDALSFGHAIIALQAGAKITRKGWNGAGQFVYYVPAASYPAKTAIAKKEFGENALVPYRAYMALKTVQGDVAFWTPSISDIFANDWQIID